MKVLIIEDEKLASDRLTKMILELEPTAEIVGAFVSVKSSFEWLKSHTAPNVIMMDINLADGQSFEIFSMVEVKTPVIFTTAYDQHALDAFKVSSIDYLLKPIKMEELKRAFDKLHSFNEENAKQMEILLKKFAIHSRDFQKRIVIRYGDTIKMVEVSDVA